MSVATAARRAGATQAVEASRHWIVVNGHPDENQLKRVINHIVQGVRPERIIVFGSAARGAMTDSSDLDLLIVKPVEDLRRLAAQARESLPSEHPPIDIVPATPQLLSTHRDCLSLVYRPALQEGVVAYDDNQPITYGSRRASETLPALHESASETMVRTLHYQREEAIDWLRHAGKDLTVVNSKDRTIDPEARCFSAQAATEKALKALLVAHGQPVPLRHKLENLATQLQSSGEKLRAEATTEKLEELSEYGGPAQYPAWTGKTTSDDEQDFCEMAQKVNAHAQKRVPAILEARQQAAVNEKPIGSTGAQE